MRRREFVMLIGSAAISPIAARAQQSVIPVVGFLGATSPDSYDAFVGGFQAGLKEAGFPSDKVTIEYRWAHGQYDRLPELAADLVSRNVSVIVATGGFPSVPSPQQRQG